MKAGVEMKFKPTAAILSMILLNCLNNPQQITGGSTNTTNAQVCGKIVHQNSSRAGNTLVFLIPADYTPKGSESEDVVILIDTTDSSGNYSFKNVIAGDYSLEAVHIVERTRLFINIPDVDSSYSDSTRLDTLKPAVKITVQVPDSLHSGFVYLAGTVGCISKVEGKTVVIDSVAQGYYPQICFAGNDSDTSVRIYKNVNISASGSLMISEYMPWKNMAKVSINTTSDGADILENLIGFPLLVRLDSKNFDFSAARSDGGDLRFSKADCSPLNYQIESWNKGSREAAVWVKIDTIFGNNSDQFIYMYWGNSSAAGLSNSGLVFDTVQGFQGVWHMDGDGVNNVYDATVNNYKGTLINGPVPVAGIIGDAYEFDGKSQYIQIKKSADSKFNFPENSYYTLSAWAYLDTLDTLYNTIVGKGWLQYQMEKLQMHHWEFTEFKNGTGWEITNSAAEAGIWTLVTGVRKGKKQYLYINGICTDSVTEIWSLKRSYDNSYDVTIGNLLGDIVDRSYYFDGKIDEVRIIDRACSPDWIKLCYRNQVMNSPVVSIVKQ